MMEEFVSVSVRIRPFFNAQPSCLKIIHKEPAVLFHTDKQQLFSFENVFSFESDQERIYNETAKHFVNKVKGGFNCTVFAYGQTGTGKTYTMGTNPEVDDPKNIGIISRALDDLFDSLHSDTDIEKEIFVSFMEIYNEKVFDLLQAESKLPLLVKGFRVEGLTKVRVYDLYEAKQYLYLGGKNRHTGETKLNTSSSRSHAVFTIYCNSISSDKKTSAKLNLVDLAGSESVKKTGTSGSSFYEGVNINKGLLSIGQVMSALSLNQSYIPYRQSIITTILQDSLNKNNFILLIACVSENQEDSIETLQTLEFAQRVKKMKNNPQVNTVLRDYKKDNPTLFDKNSSSYGSKTPYKRPNTISLQTPTPFKRPKMIPIFDNISECSNLSDSSASKSLLSVTSLSSYNSDIHQALSPVIKKYMNQMESTIIDKLQTVIRDTLKRPSRLTQEKENTTKYSWGHIRKEVLKVVQAEMLEFTSKAARATSSPIESNLLLASPQKTIQPKKLAYDSPIIDEEDNLENTKHLFKLPKLPKTNAESTRRSKRKISILNESMSPIEHANKKPRRSTRLSINYSKSITAPKDTSISIENSVTEATFNGSIVNKNRSPIRRKSIRNAKKDTLINETPVEASLNDSTSDKNNRPMWRKGIQIFQTDTSTNKTSVELNNAENRNTSPVCRSIRITNLKCGCSQKMPEIEQKEKKLKEKSKYSPRTTRTGQVIDLLNKGTKKELQQLPLVGPKTAEIIILSRGDVKFRNIQNLAELLGWSKAYYAKFARLNFLRME